MSISNIKKFTKNLFVTMTTMLVTFCAFALFDVKSVKADYVGGNSLELYYPAGTSGNYYVYVPKTAVADKTVAYGSTTCDGDGYWTNCNTRYAINTNSFTFYVMLPSTATTSGGGQWEASMTYFQYIISGDIANPFINDSKLHLDTTDYPIGNLDGGKWTSMASVGTGGMNVTVSNASFEASEDNEVYIHVRYKLKSTDQIGYTAASILYYPSNENLIATITPEINKIATESAYNLTANFSDAMENDPRVERIGWFEGNKAPNEIAAEFSNVVISSSTSVKEVSKNMIYTFFVQDRAGNIAVATYTVDNIIGSKVLNHEGNLSQNLTNATLYALADGKIVASGTADAITYYKNANVSFTAVVKDTAGTAISNSYFNWTVSVKSKNTTTELTALSKSGVNTFTWETTGYYGEYTVTVKAGDILIGSKTIIVKAVIDVTPNLQGTALTYGDAQSVTGYTYSAFSTSASSTSAADTEATIISSKGNTYDWKTMKNITTDDNVPYSVTSTNFASTYGEYLFNYKTSTFTVAQKALTITYVDAWKTYDSNSYNPNVVSAYNVVGLVYKEEISSIISDKTNTEIVNYLAGGYTITPKTVTINAAVSKNGGVNAADASLSNYSITLHSGTYTVYRIVITATYTNRNEYYKKAEFTAEYFNLASLYTYTYASENTADTATITALPNSEAISTLKYTVTPTPVVAVNDYSVSATGIDTMSSGSKDNYVLRAGTAGIFKVLPIQLDIAYNGGTEEYTGYSFNDAIKDLNNFTFNITSAELKELSDAGVSVVYTITFAFHDNVVGTCTEVTTATSDLDIKAAGV